ncbi:alpha-L-fucosidase-like [Macrobrachium rosenbergii]|uniref:alpha-L-fucosidase-like n=1 Tax=Macrobrachium rosenbergii TaxID=79674 RepID=UPI0034D6CE54
MSRFKYLIVCAFFALAGCQYTPDWDSLDSRPLPQWYDDAKIGIFVHWGVFSVPSFDTEWFWYNWEEGYPPVVDFMEKNYRPNFTYPDFAPQFTAEFFDAHQWAGLFKASGAKYVVLTSKHHEGFCNWPSKNSWPWTSMEFGPKRNLVGELADAIRGIGPNLHFGLYHSLYEWFNPLYLDDKANSFETNDFVTRKTMPELFDLVSTYKPEIVWSDGDWEAPDWYWNSTVFLSWLFNESPVKDTVVVNDRWGIGCIGEHGSYYTVQDRFNPGVLQDHKWENCFTLDEQSWGYRRNARLFSYLTIEDVLFQLATTISCGGNVLVNVGPTHDGRIPPIMEERLRQMGDWLDVNGQAVYGSRPWAYQNDTLTPGVWYTSNNNNVYAIVLSWPEDDLLPLGSVVSTPETKVNMLGYQGELTFAAGSPGIEVTFPNMAKVKSKWAWVLELIAVSPA